MPDLILSDDPQNPDKQPCISCGALTLPHARFCNSCGARQDATEPVEESSGKWVRLKQTAVFYSIHIVVCALSKFIDAFKTLGWFLFVEVTLAGTAIMFFAYNWADNKQLLRWPNFSWRKLAAYGAIAMASSFLVHYAVTWLNITVFSRDEHYYSFFEGMRGAKYYIVFFTAVAPALFEELGFRGYLLQSLLKVADKDQAIYISAFLFAVIHLCFLSLFWLIPFALFLGYARVKEKTIWYGVVFHFCFNLTACIFEFM